MKKNVHLLGRTVNKKAPVNKWVLTMDLFSSALQAVDKPLTAFADY